MASGSRFHDQRYQNWLRGILALQYWKAGLENFLDDQAVLFHDKIKNNVGLALPACSSGCRAEDIEKDVRNESWFMACSTCNAWLQQILVYHRDNFASLCEENFEPHLWSTEPWEVVKTYMSVGCKGTKHAEDTDALATLSLFKNCEYFWNLQNRPDLLEELVKVRNTLFHSSTQNVEDVDLQDNHLKMLEFLQNMRRLSPAQAQQKVEAVRKIRKINMLDLCLNKELELKALQQMQIALEQDLNYSLKLAASDPELNALQQKQAAFEQDLEATRHTLQIQQSALQQAHGSNSKKLSAINLEFKCPEETVIKLMEASEKFQDFLQENGLLQDLTIFSTRSEVQPSTSKDLDQRLSALEEHLMSKEAPSATRHGPSYSWEEQCKDLQTLLMQHYKKTCLVVQNPADNSDIELEDLYAEPAVRILRQSKRRDGLRNVRDEAASMLCRKVFYTEEYRARRIYITGDAGVGKSMLCKYLVELWCETHGDALSAESDDYGSDLDEEELWSMEQEGQAGAYSQDEIKARREENRQLLSQFKFLFYITLRDSLSEYKVNEMIQSQILQQLEDIDHVKVSDLFKYEQCLVILDGLDEWTCPKGRVVPHFVNPGIPGRDILDENTVFLTTTRPWKFDSQELRDSDVDKHAELCGVDKFAASQLCTKVIKLLNESKSQRKSKREFYRALKQKGLEHFKTIPVILIQLICLWFDDQELCTSQVHLYYSLLNFLLNKNMKYLNEQTANSAKSVSSKTSLHNCFMGHPCCRNHQHVINSLSKVAFEALVDRTKENQLVFESSQMMIYGVDGDSIRLCLKSGILSQQKRFVKVSVSEKKFSFLHKKIQEFLASVFIANSQDVQSVSKSLTDYCSTVKGCLEMSQVWLFVSGMKPDIARRLLEHFTSTATTDKQIQNYRESLFGHGLLLDIQTCVMNCITEGDNNGYRYDNICLDDYYVDKNNLPHIERLSIGNVWPGKKSLYINFRDMTDDQSTLICGQLQHKKKLQKLSLTDLQSSIPTETLTAVIDNCRNSLTSLDLNGGYNKLTLEHKAVSAICHSSSKCLVAVRLFGVKMTHKDQEKLLKKLSQSATIRQLDLWLGCIDHYGQCRPSIDLSTMTQLQRLVLSSVCIYNLPTVSQCVELVCLIQVALPVTALCEFALRISQTRRHVDVRLDMVTVREESEDRVDLETFLYGCPGLTVTHCQYDDSVKTWRILFQTDSKS